MIHTRLIATGGYLPEKVVTNFDLERRLETSDKWIYSRTGIRQRHIVADNQSTTDMAEVAARQALSNAGCRASDLDLIVVATTTPDDVFPSVAVSLQHRIGANGCAAFDVQAVCSGFVYGAHIARQFVRCGEARTVLVVGADSFSRILNWRDRSTCVLFGDGAGAVVLRSDHKAGILASEIYADGQHKSLLQVPGNCSIFADQQRSYVEMAGREVFREAVSCLGNLFATTMGKAQLEQHRLDWLVPHQANLRLIVSLAKKLRLPMERVIVTVEKHANTSAASIPLALHQGIMDKRIKPGDNVLMVAFGGGFTWGSILIRM